MCLRDFYKNRRNNRFQCFVVYLRLWLRPCLLYTDRRYNTETAVSEELLEHVLWSIDETKIHQFLRKLIPEKREIRRNVSGNKGDVIKEAMVLLREWRGKVHNESHVMQLSLALERAKCKPLDRTFFNGEFHALLIDCNNNNNNIGYFVAHISTLQGAQSVSCEIKTVLSFTLMTKSTH